MADFNLTMTITNPLSGVTAPVVGIHPILAGTVQPIDCTPAAHWHFVTWVGDVDLALTTKINEVTMDADQPIDCTMEEDVFTLTQVNKGKGAQSAGTPPYNWNDDAVITATPTNPATHAFDMWYVDGRFKGHANPITVNMKANHTLTAIFRKKHTFKPGASRRHSVIKIYTTPITEEGGTK